MIGGTDEVLRNPGLDKSAVLEAVVRSILARWRDAIIQNGDTGYKYGSYSEIAFGQVRELFVYRDQDALQSWEKLGADPSNANSMVHFIVDTDQLTIVVDDAHDRVMSSLIAESRQLLDAGVPWWKERERDAA